MDVCSLDILRNFDRLPDLLSLRSRLPMHTGRWGLGHHRYGPPRGASAVSSWFGRQPTTQYPPHSAGLLSARGTPPGAVEDPTSTEHQNPNVHSVFHWSAVLLRCGDEGGLAGATQT